MIEFLFNLPATIGHFLFNLVVWGIILWTPIWLLRDKFEIRRK